MHTLKPVSEILAECAEMRTQFRRIDVPPRLSPRVGSQESVFAENGPDVGSMHTVVDLLERAP